MRLYVLKAQDRVIRLEERMRLTALLPPELIARIPALSQSQVTARCVSPATPAPRMQSALSAPNSGMNRRRIIMKTNDRRRKGQWSMFDGSGINADPAIEQGQSSRDPDALHLEMPPIATCWKELQDIVASRGATAKGCRA
jgi:hypothetical protein